MKKLWQLKLTASRPDYERASAILALHAPFGWQEEDLAGNRLNFIIQNENRDYLHDLANRFIAMLPSAEAEFGELEATDWLASWKDFFTPVLCGEKYAILPPWLENKNFQDRRKIIIDPKSAFGTGHHATTTLCLAALDSLLNSGRLKAGQEFLDLGCGTGVLGIGAALAGLRGCLVDIDPLAVDNARENAFINNVETSVDIIEGGIEKVKGRQFDLIMANILAEPLANMAPAIVETLAAGGCLILSGILAEQAKRVMAAFEAVSLPQPRQFYQDEWTALVWTEA